MRERPDPADPESGFALLVALVVLAAITALAVGGFWLSLQERRISRAHSAGVAAFYVADGGLSEFLATHRGVPPDSVVYGRPDGSVRVRTERMGAAAGYDTVWRVWATGRLTRSGAGAARRTVEVLAIQRPHLLEVPAAMVALNGVEKRGTSGTVSGLDGTGGLADGCPAPTGEDGWGLVVEEGDFEQQGVPGGGGGGGGEAFEGEPSGIGELGDLAGRLAIDWAWIASGPPLRDTEAWPVVHVAGDHAVGAGQSGYGTLVVTGALDVSGGFTWRGLVLVGGAAEMRGDVTIRGALITGLNQTTADGLVADTEIQGGPSIHLHTGCVAAASRAFAPLSVHPGSWAEGGG